MTNVEEKADPSVDVGAEQQRRRILTSDTVSGASEDEDSLERAARVRRRLDIL